MFCFGVLLYRMWNVEFRVQSVIVEVVVHRLPEVVHQSFHLLVVEGLVWNAVNGWFRLVRYRTWFCIKPAGLVMKKIKQNVLA